MDAAVMGLFQRDIPTFLISLCGPFFSTVIIYYFMCKLLPNRLNLYGLIAISLVYSMWFNLRDPALLGTAYHLWMNIFINLWTPFILVFLFQGKFWRRVIVYWYFDIIKVICEAMAFIPIMLYQARHGFHGQWAWIVSSTETSVMAKLVYTLTYLSIFLMISSFSLKIWRRILLKKFQPFYLLFILLPMGQMFSLALLIRPNMGNLLFGILLNFAPDTETLYRFLALFGILLCLVADIALLAYTISHEKKASLEEELHEIRYVTELEQAHYQELEQRRDELAKLRHDFNNQLAAISHLARSGDEGAAQALIESLSREINQ